MNKNFLILFFCVVFAFAKAQNYTSYFTGDGANVNPSTDFGVCLMGGASESDPAMVWFLEKANGGDILVLRASGSDGYNDYFFSDLGVTVNSVETIVFNNGDAAFEPYVLNQIQDAEAIWIAGGDQWNYVSFFKDNEVEGLLNDHIVAGKPIGGTSAGMAILGDYYFSAQNGTVTSSQALSNPYDSRVTIGNEDFIAIDYLDDVITDTHFDSPDRKGRATAFLARIATDFNKRSFGITSEEFTAVCIEADGKAYVYGEYPEFQDFAYFMQANCADDFAPENCTNGETLTWNQNEQALQVYAVPGTIDGSNYFDLSNWSDGEGGTWHNWWSVEGTFMEQVATNESCEVLSVASSQVTNISVFPNPFIDSIKVTTEQTLSYVMYDITGKKVNSGMVTNDQNTLFLSSLPSGVYFIELKTETFSETIKLLKQ